MKRSASQAPKAPASELLDELLSECSSTSSVPTSAAAHVGEVLDERHPTLLGRVRLSLGDETLWCPTVAGLPVRRGDRVLVQRAVGFPEPIVVAVIDGFARRPEPELADAGRVELQRDEAVRIADHRGRPLVEIDQREGRTVLRVLSDDLDLDVPGTLRLSGKAVELRAREGNAVVDAAGDVIARGEMIHLN